jgi:hypothetical protein
MVGGVDDQPVQRRAERPVVGGWAHSVGGSVAPDVAGELSAVDLVIGAGEPQRVGRFKFFLDGQRWEWSDAVAGIHATNRERWCPPPNCCCSTNIPTIAHVSLSS